MKAIIIKNGDNQQYITVAEVPRPELENPQDVLIKVLCVGLDGTDREIITENYGKIDDGTNQMILGHEMFGKVMKTGANSAFAAGDFVTALVRRPCGDPDCINCRSGQQDFCATGKYTERGIFGADGFLCEYVVESSKYVVKVPVDCISFGVLIEPQSIVEKVWNQVLPIQQRMNWLPRSTLILGSGPLGLLAALTCRVLGIDTYVWSRSDAKSINAGIIRRIGAHYEQADKHADAGTISDQGAVPGNISFFSALTEYYTTSLNKRFDIIWECSGYSPLGFEAIPLLNFNGVLAILGTAPGNNSLNVPIDMINQEMVTKNKCVIGSVNASFKDFETSIDRLRNIENIYPGVLKDLISERIALEAVPMIDFSKIKIKTVVDLVPEDQWNEVESQF